MVNFNIWTDSLKLILKVYIYFCFNWMREMINQNILIVKIFIQI